MALMQYFERDDIPERFRVIENEKKGRKNPKDSPTIWTAELLHDKLIVQMSYTAT